MKNIKIDNRYGRAIQINSNVSIYWIGNKGMLYKIKSILEHREILDVEVLNRLLKNQSGHFSL